MESIARAEVGKYIREELEAYIRCFGSNKGFKEYITRKLNEKLARS